jgi:autotransporter-associated beta strand protein
LDISPVNSVADPHDINYYFRGVSAARQSRSRRDSRRLPNAGFTARCVIFDVGSQGSTNLNDAGGYLTGDGGITKIGAGQLTFRENNPEWTGQLIINQGSAVISSAGNPLGVGTLPIIIGHSLFAEQAGEPDSGNGTVSLLFQDEGGYRDVSVISQDIIVRADDGAGAQTKRIGAWFLANIDEVNYAGNITLRDDVQLYYRDDTRDSAITNNSTQVSNSTRSIGTLGNQETVFINFNGNLIGAAGNDITTVVEQSGNANVVNGSITGANDDLVVRAIFALNGDNSGWAGNLTIGNTTADVDTNHIVTIGNPLALSANNNLTMRNNATIRVSGNDIVVGNLSGSGTTDNFIENSSVVGAGSITITQTTDAIVDAVIRDGETVFILQPGESYQSLSLVKAGPAVLELTKGNTFTSSTTLAGGTLRLSYDADNSMLSDTAALIMNDGILDLAGTVEHHETVLETIINGSVAIERSAGTSVINLNTITRNAGSLRISADNIATTDNTNVNGILGGWATVGGSFATNSTNGADGLIVGLATFDQNIDRLTGGAGTQSIDDGAASNVRIVEDGSTASPITMTGVGTTTINTLLQAATGGEAIVEIGGGNTLRIATGGILQPNGAGALTFGQTGTLTGGAADNTAATMFIQNQDETGLVRLTVGAPIYNNGTGVVNVRTTGPGQTVFLGDNAYTGDTLVGSGQLSVGNGGTSGALGSGNVKVEPSATIEFNRSDALLHVVGELRGGGTVIQAGTGTTTLDTASTGNTLTFIMADGSLVSGTDNAINTTGTAYFGASVGSTTVGSLDLTNGSTILGGLVVRTNSTAANQLIIGAGKTLTINGTVTIGADLNNSDVALTATGGGDLVVNSSGGNFQIGGASGNNEGRTVVNLSGLTNFTANLGAGIFRLGDDNTGTGDNTSSLTLATNNTITASSIEIGDGAGGAFQHTLNLGAGTNVLNADIVNIGSAVNRRRSGGLVFFAGPTGTVDIRASDGAGRALINVVNTTTSDAATIVSVVSLNDHTANILGGAVTMAARSANTGGAVAILEFNQGTLDFLTLNMASRTGAGTGDATATLTLGDSGMVPTSATIGALNMAENTSAGGVVTATIDISGGNVSIGTGSGDAINMANAGTGNTVTSAINLTGGTTTITGNVIRTGGLGTENATLTLDGGVLNMSGNSIGTALAPVSFVAASGTLSNLGGLNGGTLVLDKTTAGTLILEGVNTYTGGTTVSTGGTLLANSTVGSATGGGVVAVLPGATLGGTGVVAPAPDTNIVINGAFAPGTPGGIIGEDMALAVSGTGSISFDGAATFDIFTNAGGANPASSNDLAIISADDWANVIFGGSSTLNVVTALDSTTWAQGDSWRLFDWDGIGGGSPSGFATLNLPALGANLFWDIGGLYTTGTIAVVVPEPSRALFLMFGLAGLLLRRRRQQGSLVP